MDDEVELPPCTDVNDYIKVALALGKEELRALKDGDVEQAEACYVRRSACMELAMAFRDTHPGELREGLLALQELQSELIHEGRSLRSALATELNAAKAQGRRLKGYKQAVSHAR